MGREAVVFNTHQITSEIIRRYNNPNDLIAFFIKNNNYHKFVENISKQDYNLEYRDPRGNTFLNLAVQCSSLEITQYLLDIGADPNSQNVKAF
jgi:ankyrin repeat protein